jgi:hypothetical protein
MISKHKLEITSLVKEEAKIFSTSSSDGSEWSALRHPPPSKNGYGLCQHNGALLLVMNMMHTIKTASP